MSDSQPKRIVFVGPLPPPVHGFSQMNLLVIEHLRQSGARVEAINIASGTSRGLLASVLRLRSVVSGMLRYLAIAVRQHHGTLYLGLSGGPGQLADLGFLIIARLFGWRIYLHHHSFSYLDRQSAVFALVARIAGRKAVHIALCEAMKAQLSRRYPGVRTIEVVSNLAFMAAGAIGPRLRDAGAPWSMLFLSNITAEKGILDFIAIVEGVQSVIPDVVGLIAGPFSDAGTERLVRLKLAQNGNLRYVGPVYDADKARVYAQADLFVFPSRYANEAEPLVVHEALAAGLPVIGTCRGCMAGLIDKDHGLIVGPDDVVGSAVGNIVQWIETDQLPSLGDRAKRKSAELRATGIAARDRLISAILD